VAELENDLWRQQENTADAARFEAEQRQATKDANTKEQTEMQEQYTELIATVTNMRAAGQFVPNLLEGIERDIERVSQTRKAMFASQKQARIILQAEIDSQNVTMQAIWKGHKKLLDEKQQERDAIQDLRNANAAVLRSEITTKTGTVTTLMQQWTAELKDDAARWQTLIDNWWEAAGRAVEKDWSVDEKQEAMKKADDDLELGYTSVLATYTHKRSREFAERFLMHWAAIRNAERAEEQQPREKYEAEARLDEEYDRREEVYRKAYKAQGQELTNMMKRLADLRTLQKNECKDQIVSARTRRRGAGIGTVVSAEGPAGRA